MFSFSHWCQGILLIVQAPMPRSCFERTYIPYETAVLSVLVARVWRLGTLFDICPHRKHSGCRRSPSACLLSRLLYGSTRRIRTYRMSETRTAQHTRHVRHMIHPVTGSSLLYSTAVPESNNLQVHVRSDDPSLELFSCCSCAGS